MVVVFMHPSRVRSTSPFVDFAVLAGVAASTNGSGDVPHTAAASTKAKAMIPRRTVMLIEGYRHLAITDSLIIAKLRLAQVAEHLTSPVAVSARPAKPMIAPDHGLTTHCARNPCVRPPVSTYAPTMSPCALIPKTRVAVAPGTSTLPKASPSYWKPWNLPAASR